MTTTAVWRAFTSVVGPQAMRTAPNLARTAIFNRFYVVAMFAVIIAISGFGIFALEQMRASGDHVDHSFEQATDATEMGTALDREYAELLSQMRSGRAAPSPEFVRATRMFDTAYREIQHDGWASGELLLKTLKPHHEEFLAQSRAIARAISAGDAL